MASSPRAWTTRLTLARTWAKGRPALIKAFGHNGYFRCLESIVHFCSTRDLKLAGPGDHTETQALAASGRPMPQVAGIEAKWLGFRPC